VDLSALARMIAARLQEAQPDRPMEFVIQPGLTAQGDARLIEVVLTICSTMPAVHRPRPRARIEFGQTSAKAKQFSSSGITAWGLT